MLRRATIGCVLLVTLTVGDALAQSSTLRAVQRLPRPAMRAAPVRVDLTAAHIRPRTHSEILPGTPAYSQGGSEFGTRHVSANSHPPLLVVDGVVFGLTSESSADDSAAQRLFLNLDPDDIATIDALKTAAAIERYGPRGNNGAVIITTKRRKESSQAAFPRLSVEAVIGYGNHTSRVGAVYYNSDGSGVVRFALDVALPRSARISPYAKAEYSPDLGGDEISICRPAPNGSCTQYPDNHNGVGLGLGIRGALPHSTSLGVLAGFGRYGKRTRHFIETEGTLKLARHFGLVGTARYMRWSRNGAPHWFAPITAGIRLF